MTNDDVIRQIGKTITEIDVLRSKFDREDQNRKRLDGIRDDLDVAQRKLVRSGLKENTEEFQSQARKLKETNKAVLKDIQDLEHLAGTLEGLVKLAKDVQRILEFVI
jgi:DNA anti-recombination protein RmuC